MSEIASDYTFSGYARVNDKVVELWKLMDGKTSENTEDYKFLGLAHGALVGLQDSGGFEIWARLSTFDEE